VVQDVDQSRVAVVDDNLPSVQLVVALLSRAGIRNVHPITDSRQALTELARLEPDLVLLDLHMPGVDGYTVLSELRRVASSADLPVLVLSADTTREATHRALSLGANDFLSKPLDAAEVVLRVRNLLHARALHVGLQRRQRWLEASGLLAGEILSGNSADPLHRVVELARDAADADLAIAIQPPGTADPESPPSGPIAIGDMSAAPTEGLAQRLASDTMQTGAPRRVDPGEAGTASGAALVVPLIGTARTLGALLLCRGTGRPEFSEFELEMATVFGTQAAVAVEFAEARADQERMLVLSDRHRIARDLHDHVIQGLFAMGLRLQKLATQIGPGEYADEVLEHVGDLDGTIAEIRSTIFGLRDGDSLSRDRLRLRLCKLTVELGVVLGFEPDLRLDLRVDTVAGGIADDVVAATREALTNVARHASAQHVEISVDLTDSDLILSVLDDGVGMNGARRRSGLANLAERAEMHGGSCDVERAPGGGTHVRWVVPLSEPPPAMRLASY